MYFYKRLLYTGILVLLMVLVVLLILMTGLSNLDGPFGAPTIVEVKFLESLKAHSPRRPLTPAVDRFVLNVNMEKSEDMEGRLKRVKLLCQSFHLGRHTWPNGTNSIDIKDPPTPLYSYFFHNREHKLAWCPVYKAGSTTWLYNMMILKGYSEEFLSNLPEQLSIFADKVYRDAEPGPEFDQARKILVVRHPFERIVSAYVDKLSNSTTGMEHGTEYYYEKYGKKIVTKFRTSKILQKEPTFEEFVQYLIKTDLVLYADDHWLPAYLSCTPCLVSYDFIAKVETYLEDQKYIIEKLGLGHVIRPRWQHRSSSGATNSSSIRSNSTDNNVSANAAHYFSQLTRNQIINLYKKYFLDFQLFDYSYESYLKFGKKDNEDS